MHKTIITLTTGLSLVLIAERYEFWDSLLVFLLVGTIPGTNLALPPLAMLSVLLLFIGFGAVLVVLHSHRPQQIKKQLPKKRYSRV